MQTSEKGRGNEATPPDIIFVPRYDTITNRTVSVSFQWWEKIFFPNAVQMFYLTN